MKEVLDAAHSGGWSFPKELGPIPESGSTYTFTRGAEKIEVEISNGGLPHKVVRTGPDGKVTSLSQGYFQMADLFDMLAADRSSKKKTTDE